MHRMRLSPLRRSFPHARRDRSAPAAHHSMTRELITAQALAYAFLDGDWTADGLIRRGTIAAGHSNADLRRLARRVLRAYPRPPWDRVRELRDWIAGDRAFALMGRRSSGRWLPYQPAMGDKI